jgi:hypothetical protein
MGNRNLVKRASVCLGMVESKRRQTSVDRPISEKQQHVAARTRVGGGCGWLTPLHRPSRGDYIWTQTPPAPGTSVAMRMFCIYRACFYRLLSWPEMVAMTQGLSELDFLCWRRRAGGGDAPGFGNWRVAAGGRGVIMVGGTAMCPRSRTFEGA